jgi:hypothetical protein
MGPGKLGVQIDDWQYIYSSPSMATRNTKLQNFQFKLSHRITATSSTGPNRLLHAGKKNNRWLNNFPL